MFYINNLNNNIINKHFFIIFMIEIQKIVYKNHYIIFFKINITNIKYNVLHFIINNLIIRYYFK